MWCWWENACVLNMLRICCGEKYTFLETWRYTESIKKRPIREAHPRMPLHGEDPPPGWNIAQFTELIPILHFRCPCMCQLIHSTPRFKLNAIIHTATGLHTETSLFSFISTPQIKCMFLTFKSFNNVAESSLSKAILDLRILFGHLASFTFRYTPRENGKKYFYTVHW